MKNIFLLFLVLCGLNILTFAQCPAEFNIYSATIKQMQNPRFWSFCTDWDLQSSLNTKIKLRQSIESSNSNSTEAWDLIRKSIELATHPRSQLVKVTSQILDISSGQLHRVDGIGTVIATVDRKTFKTINLNGLDRARYFILTVAHVSQGQNLKVRTEDNIDLPILNVSYDPTSDLALIELNTDKMQFLFRPFSYAVMDNSELTLFTFHSVNRATGTGELNISDTLIGTQYRALALEGLGAMINNGTVSSAVLAPWLPKLTHFQPDAENKDWHYVKPASRDSTFQGVDYYANGYSGSPIVSPLNNIYTLSGLLTTTSISKSRSIFISAKPILKLLNSVLGGESLNTTSVKWALLDGKYVRIHPDQIEIFLDYNPIGNGVIIEGKISPEELTNYLNKQMKLELTDIHDLQTILKNNLDQNSTANSIIDKAKLEKELQKSIGSQFKIQVK